MTKAERAHKDKLAQLGCMACRRLYGPHDPAPVELHHYRGGGWGKGDYMTLIPLCREHHQGGSGIHGLGVKAFDRHYPFTQRDLLDDALRLAAAWPHPATSNSASIHEHPRALPDRHPV